MELPQNCQNLSSNTLIFPVCKSDPACSHLPRSCLFIFGRWSHRLRACVWGPASGYHLPRGVAWGQNHHELPGSSQSTCHIHVTYVSHKPSLIITRCVFSVPPLARHLSGCIQTVLRSAFKIGGSCCSMVILALTHLRGLLCVSERPPVPECTVHF